MKVRKISLWLLCATCSPVFASAAQGQTSGQARYKKQEKEVQGVAQTNLTKPAAPPKEKKPQGPSLSLDEFVGRAEGKIQQINDQQINQLNKLIRVTPDDDADKANFYFMLAELYAEKQRYSTFQARRLDEAIFNAQPGQKNNLTAQQKQNDADAEKWLREAVKNYVAASQFKQYPRMDEVLFKLAYLLQSIKKEEQARGFFQRLIKDYPNSKYVPEAYLSFAEYYFEKGEMDAALKLYERVEQFPDSQVYGYAVYKKGWCWANLGDYNKALEIFVKVVRIAQEGKAKNKKENEALAREAKRDVVKAFARVGNVDKAWELFQRVGGDYAPKMLESLGEIYWEQGQFADSTKTYTKVISLNIDSPRICEWQGKVVRNTFSSGTKANQVQAINRLANAHDHVAKMPNLKKDEMKECDNALHDTARETALIWHKEAQKTKNTDTYQLAKPIYKIFLDHFPKDKDAYDMAFYYGELLFTVQDWREAAEQYTKVVEMNPDPNSKWLKEAAFAAVYSWQNALNVEEGGSGASGKEPDTKEFKPLPIPEYQKKMISAYDTYIKYVPNSPELVKIKYRKARIFWEYNHFDQAVPLFRDVVEKFPDDELAIFSANLLLNSLELMGRTKEVVQWVEKFMAMPQLMKDADFQKQMISVRTGSLVVAAKKAESDGKYKDCGIYMLEAADSMPDHPKHAERLYDAGTCFQNGRLIGQAIEVRKHLLTEHPKDVLAQKALFQIAANYHQIAYYTKAAEYYEQFATKYPGEKQAPVALGNAMTFRVGLGDFDKAAEDIENYIKFYGSKKPQESANVYLQKGDIYEKQNRPDEVVKHLDSYLKKFGKEGGVDKQIFAHFRMGELLWKKSCPQAGVNGACVEITRVAASGRQKALYDINKKIKDKKRKIREQRTQCGPPTKSKIVVFDRKKDLAKQAQEHFATALKLWNKGEAAKRVSGANPAEQQARIASAQNAAAGAAFYQAEAGYEDFLRVKVPEGLDFQDASQFDGPKKAAAKKKVAAESAKKFKGYLDQKIKLALRLAVTGGDESKSAGLYNRVLEYKVAHWTIAAAARIGQVYQNFSDQLYTAEIPKHLKELDEWGNQPRQLYCDTLTDVAEPYEKNAVDGFSICLKAATQESWFNEWSRLCEQELNQMKPSEYPLTAEARPEAGYVSTLMTPAPVTTELNTPGTAITPAKE